MWAVRWALVLVWSLAEADRDQEPADLVLGGGGGDGAGAAVLAALLLTERLQYEGRVRVHPTPPAACRRAPPDAPACTRALRDRLQRSFITGEPNVELGVALDPTVDVSSWRLRDRGLDYLGDLAPPARRACVVTDSPPAALAHSDLARPDVAAKYAVASDRLRDLRVDGRVRREGDSANDTWCPEWCESGGATCASLLTGDAVEAELATELVRRWRWRACVFVLGSRLSAAFRDLASSPLLACAWAPEHRGTWATASVTALAAPPCDGRRPDPCAFEPRRLAKLVDLPALVRAPRALSLLARMRFTLEQHRELASLSAELGAEEGARRWLTRHSAVADEWTAGEGRELSVAALVPVGGGGHAYCGAGLQAAARLAERHAGAVSEDVRLKVQTYDGACSARRAVKFLSDAIASGEYGSLAAVAGPACGVPLRAVATQTHAYRLPVVAYTAMAPDPASPEEGSRWLLLAAGDSRDLAAALGAVMARFGWRRLAAVTEAAARGFADPTRLRAELVHHAQLPDTHDAHDYGAVLQWAREAAGRRARVLAVGAEDGRVARAALCAGLEVGLSPAEGAVWLLPATLPDGWLRRDSRDAHNCTQEHLDEMAEGHLSVGGAWLEAGEGQGARVAAWRRDWLEACRPLGAACPPRPPPHAALLYDSLLLLSHALRSLLSSRPSAAADLHHPDNARTLVENAIRSNYSGLTGPFVFRPDGTRKVAVLLHQWENGTQRRIGRWDPDEGLALDEDAVRWRTADGTRPDDGGERCALGGLAALLRSDCQTAFVALGALVLAALAAALGAVFVHCKRRVERDYRRRLREADFGALAALRGKTSGLDRWELARERVVINRKLGTGAFGAVFGGHALLGEGRGWTAVAVKTLKPGAGTEEKLDFLSEAETMKRFEHRNVVRLLGVVTAQEPVCTVMELMLYGDLKSFLLARRHVAAGAEGAGPGAEVCPRRLSGWALDAARALSYLASLRYVHRDVAARNCLLSARRVLKLADFGMTRLVFENDYYRFSRKGMLPVRWMAPESLRLGVFSPASDIWSFGVLLYEIVTFGALPFQGLSNAEVLAHAKAGRTVTLPPGLKPQLEALIKSCWRQEHKARPPAAEVAALLADSPRLLTACLDMPLDTLPFDAEPTDPGETRWASPTSARSTSAATDTTYLSADPRDAADTDAFLP